MLGRRVSTTAVLTAGSVPSNPALFTIDDVSRGTMTPVVRLGHTISCPIVCLNASAGHLTITIVYFARTEKFSRRNPWSIQQADRSQNRIKVTVLLSAHRVNRMCPGT